jgi:MAM domain, meprin/A5/mu/Somatomedin B domain
MQFYGAAVTFFCNTGYVAAGNRNAYCNGTDWDRALGICRETPVGPQLTCDFETDDICGWTHDYSHDFEWRRRNGHTSSRVRTGPMHDHTSMKPLEGFYMLSESLAQKKNDKARLISPTFAAENSVDTCFRLFYHMYRILVGRLAVYVKPVSKPMSEILDKPKYKVFNVTGNKGNVWKEAYFTIDQNDEEFQIVIEASIGMSHLSDIAIDDVALMTGAHCTNEQFKSTTPEFEKNGGVFDVQTCKDRCRETESMVKNETDVITDGAGRNDQVLHCDCFPGCGKLKTCCSDYSAVCFTDDVDEMSATPDTYEDMVTDTLSSEMMVNTTTPVPRTSTIPVSITTTTMVLATTISLKTTSTATITSISTTTTPRPTTTTTRSTKSASKAITSITKKLDKFTTNLATTTPLMTEKDIKIIEKEGKKPLGVELSKNCKFRQILIDEIF